MIGALVFTVVASVLLAVFEVGPRRMRYWRRFAPSGFWPSQIGLAVVYVFAGAAGWYLNDHYIVHPAPSRWLLNGLLSVGIGQAVLRFDPSLLEVEGRGPARTLLVGAQKWLFENVEEAAFNAVGTEVGGLSDDELEQLALYSAELAADRNDISRRGRVEILQTLTEAAKDMRSTSHAAGRARLQAFSVKTITENRFVFLL